jgi:hypothetical protein
MIVHCANPECPEFNIAKNAHGPLPAGEHILCGHCGIPVVDEAHAEIVGPLDLGPFPPQPPTVEELIADLTARVEALEAGGS